MNKISVDENEESVKNVECECLSAAVLRRSAWPEGSSTVARTWFTWHSCWLQDLLRNPVLT